MTALLPRRRRILARPRQEPIASPSGLAWLVSRKRLPCRIRRSRSSGAFVVVATMEALQEIGDVLTVLRAAVELEGQLGRDAQMAQAPGDFGTQETLGVLERLDGRDALGFLAEDGDIDGRVAQVGGHVDRGDGREPDPRILDLAQEEVRELRAQDVPHPIGAPAHACASSTCGCHSVKYASGSPSIRSRISSSMRSASLSVWATAAIEISARCRRS